MDVLRIGRAPDNNLVLDDASVSRYHARLFNRSGRWYILDLNSTHGTTVNGKKFEGPLELKPSDTIMLSEVELSFSGRAIFSAQGKKLLALSRPAVPSAKNGPAIYNTDQVLPSRSATIAPKHSKLVEIAGLSALFLFFVLLIFIVSENKTEPDLSDFSSFTPSPQAVIDYEIIPYDDGEYIGWLRDGLPHGQGTLRYPAIGSSSSFVDRLVHRGTRVKMYEGEWQNGLKHGYGKMTHPNGKVEEGYWEYDRFIGRSSD